MPSKYISRRDKVMQFIKTVVFPSLAKKVGSYEKTVSVIVVHNGTTPKLAKECLDASITAGLIVRQGDKLLQGAGEIRL